MVATRLTQRHSSSNSQGMLLEEVAVGRTIFIGRGLLGELERKTG